MWRYIEENGLFIIILLPIFLSLCDYDADKVDMTAVEQKIEQADHVVEQKLEVLEREVEKLLNEPVGKKSEPVVEIKKDVVETPIEESTDNDDPFAKDDVY